jgi:transcriptional regulator with XRE-family HTH domain
MSMPEASDWRTGVKLPGLRGWRKRRGLNQTELAQMAGVTQNVLTRVESVQRGCNPEVAQKLAEILDVDLQDLKGEPGDEPPAPPEEPPSRPPARPVVTCRYIHRAYLQYILAREVGTSYAALSEGELKKHCAALPLERVLEIISEMNRETEFVERALEDPELPPEMRLFFEEIARQAPEANIRLLLALRSEAGSEERRQELTRAMRELL